MGVFRRTDGFMRRYFPNIWRLLKIGCAAVTALIILVVLTSFVLDLLASGRLRAAREDAARLGVPLSVKEFVARRGKLPGGANAADCYEAAFAMLRREGIGVVEEPVPLVSKLMSSRGGRSEQDRVTVQELWRAVEDPSAPLPDYILAATKKYVEDRHNAVEAICRAAALDQSQYELDYDRPASWARFSTAVRSAANLMCLAAWVDAEDGRPQQALEKIRATLKMAASITAGEGEKSIFCRSWAIESATQGLQRVLSRADASPGDLEYLQRDFERLAKSDVLRTAMEFRCAWQNDMYASLLAFGADLPDDMSLFHAIAASARIHAVRVPDGVRNLVIWLMRSHIKCDQAAMIRVYLAFIERPGDPVTAGATARSRAAAELINTRFSYYEFLVRDLQYLVRWAPAPSSRLLSCAAAMAAIRYRHDTGNWPATLEALVPAYLGSVPIDPMSGRPPIYLIMNDGVMVYSVSEDGIDSGGKRSLVQAAAGDNNHYDDFGCRVIRRAE